MRPAILDTDILSEILKGVDPIVGQRAIGYQTHFSQLTFTSASVLEILAGYRKRGAQAQRQRAAALFATNSEIVPDADDYRLAADIIGDLLIAGRPVGMIDPMIAACAIRRGFVVASGNTRHYEFMRQAGYGFQLENWRQP